MADAVSDLVPERVVVGRGELTPIPPRPTPRHPPRPWPEPRSARRTGLAQRTRDMLAANVTDFLDKAEDPAKMIRMVIVEMEETLITARAAIARTIADRQEMRRQVARLERLCENWTEKAELALSKDREDLARAALVEKHKAAGAADHIAAGIASLDGARAASEIDIARLEARLREARTRQRAIAARMESAHNRLRLREMTVGARVDEAFARFALLERRADLAEGHADELVLGAPIRSVEDEIAEFCAAEKASAALASMKAARASRV